MSAEEIARHTGRGARMLEKKRLKMLEETKKAADAAATAAAVADLAKNSA